jgi:hypothetical protein
LGRINEEVRDHAVRAADAFAHEYGAKWPKAVAKIVDDLEVLLAFFDLPAEHWLHLKTRIHDDGIRVVGSDRRWSGRGGRGRHCRRCRRGRRR